MGEIDKIYDNINNAFLLTSLNYKFESNEMLEVFDAFRRFSLRIDEIGEHEIYCNKMEIILEKISSRQSEDKTRDRDSINNLYYQMSILDGLTESSDEKYTVDTLKKYYKKYEEIQKYKSFTDQILNNNSINDPESKDKIKQDVLFYILYCNIKLKSFFKKENKVTIIKEIKSLIDKILSFDDQSSGAKYNYCLVQPCLLLIKNYMKLGETEKLEEFILNDWCNLIDSLTGNGDNILLAANYSLMLTKNMLTNNKDYRVRLSNLLNFAGDNYSAFFEFDKDPKNTSNYIYAEICYLAAFINKNDPKMIPWQLAGVAAETYLNILGQNSEKYKKALKLFEIVEKQHNVQKS